MELQKALFLDRDGVINIDYGYVSRKEEFIFNDDIFKVCREARKKNYKIFIITNQAGIGRGYYTKQEYLNLSMWVESFFQKKEIKIDKTYFCPHHPIHGLGKYKKDCKYRKPYPGMILRAKCEYKLNIEDSILIGDKISDIEAGDAAGIKKLFYFVSSDNSKKTYNTSINYTKLCSLSDVIDYM